jgi:hypothetical protein
LFAIKVKIKYTGRGTWLKVTGLKCTALQVRGPEFKPQYHQKFEYIYQHIDIIEDIYVGGQKTIPLKYGTTVYCGPWRATDARRGFILTFPYLPKTKPSEE